MRLRSTTAGLVAATLLLSTTLNAPGPALACNPGRSIYAWAGFSGTQRTVSGVYGVQTRLETYQSYIQGSARARAWNMLTKPGIPGGQQWWAQVGWSIRKDSQGWIYSPGIFTSWTDNVGNYWVKDYAGVLTGQYYYTWYLSSNGKRFTIQVGATSYGTVTAGWTPSIVEIYGETHDHNTQMPGDTSNKVRMDEARYWVGSYNYAIDSTAGANDSTIFGATKVNSTTYDIWDKNCSAPGGN